MKTNQKIMLAGAVIFALGIGLLAYEKAEEPDFKISVDDELLIIFSLITPGIIIAAIGMVLEFAKQEFQAKK